jgi:hypothetical protein
VIPTLIREPDAQLVGFLSHGSFVDAAAGEVVTLVVVDTASTVAFAAAVHRLAKSDGLHSGPGSCGRSQRGFWSTRYAGRSGKPPNPAAPTSN